MKAITILRCAQRYHPEGDLYRSYIRLTSSDNRSILDKILKNTVISKDHLTPEIGLHLITTDCEIYHAPILDESVFPNDPFWGFYWPGGQAISRYILDYPEIVRNKNVLDFGSGCGASSIAAYISGAKHVTANDIDEVAGIAAQLNGKLNNISAIPTISNNLIGTSDIPWEVILLGDLCYDDEFANELFLWLRKLRNLGKQTYVGDPGRHGLTPDKMEILQHLKKYELPENSCIENHGFKFVNVYRLK